MQLPVNYKNKIRNTIIDEFVKRIQGFGHREADNNNVMTDTVYKTLFLSFLNEQKDMKEYGKPTLIEIDDMISELQA